MTSRLTVLAVVIGLAVFSLAALAGAVLLIALGKQAPDQLWTLVGVAVGALGSVLASTRSTLGPNDTEPSVISGAVRISSSDPQVAP